MKYLFAVILVLGFQFSATAAATRWQAIECCNVSHVDPPGVHPAPGNMGPNAFYFMWHVSDARIIGDHILIDMSYRPSKDLRNEWTDAGVLRVVIPFSEFASIEFQEMVEHWHLNDQGMADYASRTRSGSTLNDLVATMKFNILKEGRIRPAVTLEGITKTANGNADDGRNSDSAGYEIGALIAKDIVHASGVLRKIRILSEIGFFSWDDGIHSQNDAYQYGLTTEFIFKKDATIDAGIHGFTGWRTNGDAPLAYYIEGRKVFNRRVTGFESVDIGINSKANPSANPFMMSAGIRISLHRGYSKKSESEK